VPLIIWKCPAAIPPPSYTRAARLRSALRYVTRAHARLAARKRVFTSPALDLDAQASRGSSRRFLLLVWRKDERSISGPRVTMDFGGSERRREADAVLSSSSPSKILSSPSRTREGSLNRRVRFYFIRPCTRYLAVSLLVRIIPRTCPLYISAAFSQIAPMDVIDGAFMQINASRCDGWRDSATCTLFREAIEQKGALPAMRHEVPKILKWRMNGEGSEEGIPSGGISSPCAHPRRNAFSYALLVREAELTANLARRVVACCSSFITGPK